MTGISIHALTKSAILMATISMADHIFQSTHSRRVRCHRRMSSLCEVAISIHALTKSAIKAYKLIGDAFCISIHALTKSAIFQEADGLWVQIHFNPRTHEECDDERIHVVQVPVISIHALTKSAMKRTGGRSFSLKFQSTHSRRVRFGLSQDYNRSTVISIHALTKSAMLKDMTLDWNC